MDEPEKTWYLATCLDCEPILPQPFRSEDERDWWAKGHRVTGHTVVNQTAKED